MRVVSAGRVIVLLLATVSLCTPAVGQNSAVERDVRMLNDASERLNQQAQELQSLSRVLSDRPNMEYRVVRNMLDIARSAMIESLQVADIVSIYASLSPAARGENLGRFDLVLGRILFKLDNHLALLELHIAHADRVATYGRKLRDEVRQVRSVLMRQELR